jgi:hypothetical protein
MRPRFLPVLLAVLLASGTPTYGQAGDTETEKGIRQAQEGEFEQAIVTLRGALPRLVERKAPPRDIARAHVYLGVAHLGLNDPATARTSFLEALRVDPTLTLGSDEYPPRILRAFEEARRAAPSAPATAAPEKTAASPTTAPAAAPAPPSAPPSAKAEPPAKKGGSKLPLVLLGVGAVAGGVALAAGGGGGGSSSSSSEVTPTPTPPPGPTGSVALVATFPPTGGSVKLSSDPNAGSPVPEVTFDVTYGADVPDAAFEINLWRGPDLCFSTQTAYANRLDSAGVQYKAGTTARYRVNWWTSRQPGCGNSFVTDRFEFFWGRSWSSLFVQNLGLGWNFSR